MATVGSHLTDIPSTVIGNDLLVWHVIKEIGSGTCCKAYFIKATSEKKVQLFVQVNRLHLRR